MYKLGVYIFLNRVPFPPSLKSCGFKNSMKLGGCQKKFKVTLLERPSEKSCSTSQKKRGFQKKIQSYPLGEASRKIMTTSKDLTKSAVSAKILSNLVRKFQSYPLGEASKKIKLNFFFCRASHVKNFA